MARAAGGAPFDIALGSGGGVYVTGTVSAGAVCSGRVVPNAGGHDILLMRLSSAGTCDWALGIGSSGEDEAHAMRVEASGDVVVPARFRARWTLILVRAPPC